MQQTVPADLPHGPGSPTLVCMTARFACYTAAGKRRRHAPHLHMVQVEFGDEIFERGGRWARLAAHLAGWPAGVDAIAGAGTAASRGGRRWGRGWPREVDLRVPPSKRLQSRQRFEDEGSCTRQKGGLSTQS